MTPREKMWITVIVGLGILSVGLFIRSYFLLWEYSRSDNHQVYTVTHAPSPVPVTPCTDQKC